MSDYRNDFRRLPVYVLLDTSGSMMGAPIESVNQGLQSLFSDLMSDPRAMETAYLSVITFDSAANQVIPLTELGQFQIPTLSAAGPTMMGEAMELLEHCLDTEVRKAGPGQQGDYRPLIFLMTDGVPSDEDRWKAVAGRIKARRVGNIIACAAGDQANADMLKHLTDTVVALRDLQPDQLREFFKWVSGSVKRASDKIGQATPDQPIGLPPLPPQITIVP